jgi:hypothetical protein
VAYCRKYSTTWETLQNVTGKTGGLKAQIWTRKSPILSCVLNMSLLMRLEPVTMSSPAKPKVKLRCIAHLQQTCTPLLQATQQSACEALFRKVPALCNWNVRPSCKVKSSYITTMDKSALCCRIVNLLTERSFTSTRSECNAKLRADINYLHCNGIRILQNLLLRKKKITHKSLCLKYFLC